jgi:hypothetical protein
MSPRPAPCPGLLIAAIALALAAHPAPAAPPPPLVGSLFSFPGTGTNPSTGASAGLALADRWLGDDPFANPAGVPGSRLSVSGLMLHMSRQDLRAGNRNFDETPAFFDGAGLAVGLPARGRLGVSLYAFQPVLRQETNAFTRGTVTSNPSISPATIEAQSSAREVRAGAALSLAVGPARIGAGAEWTRRKDFYQTVESSGGPQSGLTRLELSGDAIGFQVGARLDRGDSSVGGMSVGLGLRRLPALPVDAPFKQDLLLGTTDSTLRAEREAGWESGISARVVASPAFRVLAALGGRTAQRWEGLDLAAGRAWEWKVAADYHDARDPWTLRAGLGQERQAGVPEHRADILGLGFGWQFEWGMMDVGLTHRTIARAAAPNSFEDRVVVTVRAPR